MKLERISAVTLKVADMRRSVIFYRDVLGLELIFGGEETSFSTLCMDDPENGIINLERGETAGGWGRIILYVDDVDACWNHLKVNGYNPPAPRDATWGERYFHFPDPDGHELSFAKPL